MSKTRGYVAADPTAWKAVSRADRQAAKKAARAKLQEQGFDADDDKIHLPKPRTRKKRL